MINHFIEQHLQLPPTRLLIKRTINHSEQADHQAGSIKYHIGLRYHQFASIEDNFFCIQGLPYSGTTCY